ncbi:MAG TPA: aminotransferase class I/II-fold pyridoxal phosphate-dependent enzyme, partial [Nitrospiria bacterium]|nr:aminotransferase class I/II-fold pyridoxal phosphate-dependent enzyme [Nitrospiria bacterium]
GIYALSMEDPAVDQILKTYQERRDVFVNGLRGLGFDVPPPQASFYVWVPVPSGTTSEDFTALLLSKAGIVSTPGKGFGDAGEGYVRMTLTVRKERLVEAIDRIEKTGIRGS